MGENTSRPGKVHDYYVPANLWTAERLWPFQGRFFANLTARITSALVRPRSSSLIERTTNRNSSAVSFLMRLDSTGHENSSFETAAAEDFDDRVDHLLDVMASPPLCRPARSRSLNSTLGAKSPGLVCERFENFARLYGTSVLGRKFNSPRVKGTFSLPPRFATSSHNHSDLSNQSDSDACPRLCPEPQPEIETAKDNKMTITACEVRSVPAGKDTEPVVATKVHTMQNNSRQPANCHGLQSDKVDPDHQTQAATANNTHQTQEYREATAATSHQAVDSHLAPVSRTTNPCISFILGDASSNDSDSDLESRGSEVDCGGDDLWESFVSSDDPYNPLSGWQCGGGGGLNHPPRKSTPKEIPAAHTNGFIQHKDSVIFYTQQLGEGCDREKEGELADLPLLFPPVCGNKNISFILGDDGSDSSSNTDTDSQEGSDCEEARGSESSDCEEAEGWEDSDGEDSDRLWQSFMQTNDPYSPINGWKCGGHQVVKAAPAPPRARSSGVGAPGPGGQRRPSRFSRHRDSICLYPGLEALHWSPEERDLAESDESAESHGGNLSGQTAPAANKMARTVTFKQVRFAEGGSLSSVHTMVAWDYAYRAARKGPWVEYARDRCHFQRRINQTNHLIAPCLDSRHRQRVYSKLHVNCPLSL